MGGIQGNPQTSIRVSPFRTNAAMESILILFFKLPFHSVRRDF